MSQGKTLKQELHDRHYRKQGHLASLLTHTITWFLAKKYSCQYTIIDDIKQESGPCFVIFNHLSRFDHVFITQIMRHRPYNMIAAHHEFFREDFSFFFKIGNTIPKTNYTLDITTMKAIKKVISQGGTVCFSPEGTTSRDGKNRPVVPGTGTLFKKYKIPVYYIELRGQYMIASKVCRDERLGGQCFATMRKIYSPEDLETRTGDEIDQELNLLMKHDEYEWQKEKHYRYKMHGEACKNLEDLCFLCPKCGSLFQMKSKGNDLYCSACGNGLTMDAYYDFHPWEGSQVPETPSKWYDLERRYLIQKIRKEEDFSFSISVTLGELPKHRLLKKKTTTIPCGAGVVTIDHQGVRYEGTRKGKPFTFLKPYDELFSVLSAHDLKDFSFYVGTDYYEFTPKPGEEGKIGYIHLLVEEMHRLHSNKFANFPWCQEMYE